MSKKRSRGVQSFWVGTILVSLLLVLFSLIFVSCSKPDDDGSDVQLENSDGTTPNNPDEGNNTDPENGDDPLTGSESPQPVESPTPGTQPPTTDPEITPPVQSQTQLAETADMGREYLDKIYFLGDSTTYGLGYYYDHGYTDLVTSKHVWTPASGTLTLDQWSYVAIVNPDTGEEMMLPDLLELKKPEYLCITLGVNGVSFMKEQYFKDSYTSLVKKVQEVSPNTKIILNSIYPVTTGYEQKNNGINNLKIEAANLWVRSVAESCGVNYLDSASALRNENGVLPDEHTNGDGLHLNGEAFGLVVQYIRTHGC
ncbi:MAG: SGNH/GDSL hydrolase family protein [Oscillospiraceae bacterium]|nr:SGNH/GDSL hydrolase family protein [Oscillospiraceae bacterium]